MKLEVKNISKRFGEAEILRDISFTAEGGKAIGFLGRNGAGKTTTLRIILDVFKPNFGEVLFNGEPLKKQKITIGYLPEERGLYQDETLLDQLIYFCRLKGAKKDDAREDVLYWLERFDLTDVQDKELKTFSKGNRQKAQIIVALLNKPEILILDEPFSGLDPINAEVLRTIIREFIDDKKIVIFSSHQMEYVEEFCQDIAIINHGEIVLEGNINVIRSNMATNKLILSAGNLGLWQMKDLLQGRGYIKEEAQVHDFKILVELEEGVSKDQVLDCLQKNEVDITTFTVYEPRLQEIFIQEVGEIIG